MPSKGSEQSWPPTRSISVARGMGSEVLSRHSCRYFLVVNTVADSRRRNLCSRQQLKSSPSTLWPLRRAPRLIEALSTPVTASLSSVLARGADTRSDTDARGPRERNEIQAIFACVHTKAGCSAYSLGPKPTHTETSPQPVSVTATDTFRH